MPTRMMMTTTRMTTTRTMNTRDFYCNQKFWWLTVNLERKNISSCCSASPHTIDVQWLEKNPEQIFNTSNLLQERKDMLDGIRVQSCEATCWSAEDRGSVSRRNSMKGEVQTHHSVVTTPEVLNIIVNTDCNMTCVYCCKQYSNSWYRDIQKNGPYLDDTRYIINNEDRIIEALGQKQIKNSRVVKVITGSISQLSNLRSITISGGEPFLYNGLTELTNSFSDPIEVFTGLGVDSKRFASILDKLGNNVSLVISGESTEKLYEFVRYGNSYQNFLLNIDSIKQRGIPYRFSITMSNLTIFGYKEFEDRFGNESNTMQFCNDPDYLSVAVLDPKSVEILASENYKYNNTLINSALRIGHSLEQKSKFVIFLKEYARRRNLSMDIFPRSFIDWINQP